MSGRCKACDRILSESEIIWNDDTQLHEELCRGCRANVIVDIATDPEREDDGMYDHMTYLDDMLDDGTREE